MTDYQENKGNEALLNAIKFLGIKFPVAEIVRKTGYSKSVVSTYLKENANPSNEFLKKFEENFNVDLNDFSHYVKLKLSEPNTGYTTTPDFDTQIKELEEKIKEYSKYIETLKITMKKFDHELDMLELWHKHLSILIEAKKRFL